MYCACDPIAIPSNCLAEKLIETIMNRGKISYSTKRYGYGFNCGSLQKQNFKKILVNRWIKNFWVEPSPRQTCNIPQTISMTTDLYSNIRHSSTGF